MAPQCTALNLSDERWCEDAANSLNGLFCAFHSRQCQGLYRGYKNRNARLAALEEAPPSYLAKSKIALANQTFADIDGEDALRELYDHLFLKLRLLDRVIRARKLHHGHFFSMNCDYRHQHYLDVLSSRRNIVIRVLERLERRTGEVLYEKAKWFKWVRECQDTEEQQRENEKKKIKKEAALFRRHMKEVQSRMRELRAKEDLKRQETYLEEAYKEALSQEEQEAEWDPIEDVIDDERGNYIDLIKHILFMTDSITDDQGSSVPNSNPDGAGKAGSSATDTAPMPSTKSEKSKQKAVTNGASRPEIPDKAAHDTRSQVRKRLKEGVKVQYGKGMHRAGTIENLLELKDKTAPFPDEEIDELLKDMAEIKHLLFCRLLLSHATVLPAAIQSSSVEEFLNNSDVTDKDLRDLALKMDNPGLQEIRDACADLGRGEEEEDDHYENDEDEDDDDEVRAKKIVQKRKEAGLQGTELKIPSSHSKSWAPEREKKTKLAMQERQSLVDQSGVLGNSGPEHGKTMIDFGDMDDQGKFKSQKMRGLIPYQQFEEGPNMTSSRQTGSSRGHIRRTHEIVEQRNFMCANINRNDPVMRRFCQYIAMKSSSIVVVIRDAKTGRIVFQPPRDELWLTRKKSGIGRASKNEWTVLRPVDEDFFQRMEDRREWCFGFNDYYDLYMWDLIPGRQFAYLSSTIFETLVKAHRLCSAQDRYNPAAATLKTITRDPVTFRTRDIRLGEDVTSIWDEVQRDREPDPDGETLESQIIDDADKSKSYFYNEADMLEDAVLFPEELSSKNDVGLFKGTKTGLNSFFNSGPDWVRFINDLSTDEESDDEEDLGYLLEDESQSEDDGEQDESSEADNTMDSAEELHNEVVPHSSVITQPLRRDLALLSSWKQSTPYGENVEPDFWTFMDPFKKSWHAGDLEPGSQERYREANTIIKQMNRYQDTLSTGLSWVQILRFLDIHPHRNRRVVPDICDARAMVTLFFDPHFFLSEYGAPHKSSPLFKQAERARHPPSGRPHASNKDKPKSFWEEFDAFWKDRPRDDPWPMEWDTAIRPIIAKLYKAGIIGNHYDNETPGRALAAAENGRERDLYIDLRIMIDDIKFGRDIEHPPSNEHLLSTARAFAKSHPNARFALLRLWSAPHFYPLMVGLENRSLSSFTDALGRAWEWNFLPKDMPGSEISMHQSARLRILSFKHLLGERVLVKRNLYMVMGTDEEDLQKFAIATTFVVQMEPWRLEVDLWKSFVNVNFEFLEGLDSRWLD
ncbi:hypothetical protein P7C71_g3680, partial [Lecanoromycetidae sp. Uapishka_2]